MINNKNPQKISMSRYKIEQFCIRYIDFIMAFCIGIIYLAMYLFLFRNFSLEDTQRLQDKTDQLINIITTLLSLFLAIASFIFAYASNKNIQFRKHMLILIRTIIVGFTFGVFGIFLYIFTDCYWLIVYSLISAISEAVVVLYYVYYTIKHIIISDKTDQGQQG